MIALNRSQPIFEVGQLVVHKRYHYRGVIVACDYECQAPDEWYRANKTQPDRHQPWYHVLVHASSTMTYAAQTSLRTDDTHTPIEHPLVDHFFAEFNGQKYLRNDRPFPEGI